jgi:integrase
MGRVKASGPKTLGDLLDHLWTTQYQRKKNSATVQSSIRALKKGFGADTNPAMIDRFTIDQWVQDCMGRRLSASTVNRRLSILSRALNYAEEARLIERMPKIEYMHVRARKLVWMSKDEEVKVVDWLNQRGDENVAQYVEVLLDTGMRPGELLSLKRQDVDFVANEINVLATKTNTHRKIPMTMKVASILRARMKRTNGLLAEVGKDTKATKDHIFPYTYRHMVDRWVEAQEYMGWRGDGEHTLYVCRHTFASRLIQKDVPLPIISQLMGHSSYQQTLAYAKLKGGQGQQAIKSLEGML